MALDTQEKRMAVVGVGRPWMRSKLPSSNDVEWRASSGLTFGANGIALPPDVVPFKGGNPMIVSVGKMMGR